jgi:tetratricopeptide (TPR) repeat protein
MANGEELAILDRDTPLILAVSIVDYDAIEAASLNDTGRKRGISQRIASRSAPWTGMVRFFRLDDGRKQPLRWKTVVLSNPKPDSVAVLDAFTSAAADFGVDEANLAAIAPGRYMIRAGITGRAAGGGVESNDIVVELREMKKPENRDTEEKRLNTAYYAYRRAQYRTALSEVQEVIARNPRNVAALILLGDVQFAMRKYREALAAYQEALTQYQAQDPAIEEEPRALLGRIAATEQKLSRRR